MHWEKNTRFSCIFLPMLFSCLRRQNEGFLHGFGPNLHSEASVYCCKRGYNSVRSKGGEKIHVFCIFCLLPYCSSRARQSLSSGKVLCSCKSLSWELFPRISAYLMVVYCCVIHKDTPNSSICAQNSPLILLLRVRLEKVYRRGFLRLGKQKKHVFLCFSALPSLLTQDSQIWLFQNN